MARIDPKEYLNFRTGGAIEISSLCAQWAKEGNETKAFASSLV